MRRSEYVRPDGDAMERLLAAHNCDPPGIVLRLAWKEGLARKEISALTWDDVDFDASLLCLPGREIPLDAETAGVLALWKRRCERFTPYVAASDKLRQRLATESLSMMVRRALDEEGQTGVTLKDLRYDYIVRQQETHDWPYVLRVSGISLSSYRSYFATKLKKALQAQPETAVLPAPVPQESPPAWERGTDEFRLWKLMQQKSHTPAGIAIWLVQQMGLQLSDIVLLTWGDVDFAAETVRVCGEEIPMTRGVARVLREEHSRRGPQDDPHVILSEKTGKPIGRDRLSILVRDTMIHGGITDVTALDLRFGLLRGLDWNLLREHVEKEGAISPREAMKILDVSESVAWKRLQMLTQMGYLVHVGHWYYSAKTTPPAEKLKEYIYQYIERNGSIGCKEASELLRIPYRRVGHLLRTMAKNGELDPSEKLGRYVLPAAAEAAEA